MTDPTYSEAITVVLGWSVDLGMKGRHCASNLGSVLLIQVHLTSQQQHPNHFREMKAMLRSKMILLRCNLQIAKGEVGIM